MKTVIHILSKAINARRNCKDNDNTEWEMRWLDLIRFIQRNLLPHGSGIDAENDIDVDKSNEKRILVYASYHAMNENGYYDGWIDYTVKATPAFDGIELSITGNFGKYQDVKEYLYEIYHAALTEEVDIANLWKRAGYDV